MLFYASSCFALLTLASSASSAAASVSETVMLAGGFLSSRPHWNPDQDLHLDRNMNVCYSEHLRLKLI